MPRRFPLLLLKNRGQSRAASPWLARLGEGLYHAMFVAMGVIGIWWTLSDVLIPEWRLGREAAEFDVAPARVVGERVVKRPGLAESEYCAELELEFVPNVGDPIRVWTRHGVGRDTPSRTEAEAALEQYTLGETRACWFDPDDPQRVMISVRRRWWPWLVLSIPISLLVAGVLGLVRTTVSRGASPERRSALAIEGLDLGSLDPSTPRPTVASGLPPAESADASPGVSRAYRLPADGSDGWRVAGMATLCVVWNLLVVLFAYQMVADYLSVGWRIAVATAVAVPLAVVGVRMTLPLWREARGVAGSDTTRVELERTPLRVGRRTEATLLQSGQMRLRALSVWLVCEEIATYRQGTDARTAIAEVYRRPLLNERRLVIDLEEPVRREFAIDIPAESPHSFISSNNEVRWSLEVMLQPAGRGESRRRFPLCVYPPPTAPAVTDEIAYAEVSA